MSPGTLLRSLLAALDGEVQRLYDDMEVPFRPRFFPVVQQLRASADYTVGTLARRVGVTQPAMTQTIAEMRERGLIAPGRDLALTPEGEALCARLEPVWLAIESAAVQLDRELPAPLAATMAAALARLEEKPFAERIDDARRTQ